MITRFGSREICDVTFKALTNNQKVGNKEFKAGQPVFVIDTATTSNMEQASTTVYAQGGKGYNRLIAWEGEKTMTFTVTDALMSPLGLAILTGAGFAKEDAKKHIHATYDVAITAGLGEITKEELANELGISASTAKIFVCADKDLVPYATKLDGNGAIEGWVDKVVLSSEAGTDDTYKEGTVIVVEDEHALKIDVQKEKANPKGTYETETTFSGTVKLDFYVLMGSEATEITIGPDDFGGYFYVEADTLYRNQDGKDMAATLTFPKVKIQSGFTLTMAANGDPSTFDFVMDAFPAYTFFDHTKKVVCDMTVVGGSSTDSGVEHSNPTNHSKN